MKERAERMAEFVQTSEAPTMSPRQREMLYAVEHHRDLTVGLCDLIDPDFRLLIAREWLYSWKVASGEFHVCITMDGRRALDAIDN